MIERITRITKLWMVLLSCILLFNHCCRAEKLEISEIYIEDTGNNAVESKLKAHEHGMLRVFFLLTDKMGLDRSHFTNPTYDQLSSVFLVSKISEEIAKEESYRATVNYFYNRMDFYRLLVECGDEIIQDKFNEYLIIPVLKQRRVLNIWNNDHRWNDLWFAARERLAKYGLIEPEKTLHIAKVINADNLFNLSYDDFAGIFSDKLFKKVMIVSAELFTDRESAQTIMKVKKYILTQNSTSPKVLEEQIMLDRPDDVEHKVGAIINKLISEFGVYKNSNKSKEEILAAQIEQAEGGLAARDNIIIMVFDAFDDNELQNVIGKLKKVRQIDNFDVKSNNNNQYVVRMVINSPMDELAKGLYFHALSYRQKGEIYKLIDIQKGG